MLKQRRLALALGAAGGGLAAAALFMTPVVHADGEVTLGSAGPEVPYTALGPDGYVGFQPFFTEWQQNQPTDVYLDGSKVAAGSYDVFETDRATPYTDSSVYDFGAATSGGTDPGGLEGATVSDFAYDPSFNAATEQMPPADVTAALDNIYVTFSNGNEEDVLTTAMGTDYYVDDPASGSAFWFEAAGSTVPTELFSNLPDTSAALAAVESISSLLPPDVWWPGI